MESNSFSSPPILIRTRVIEQNPCSLLTLGTRSKAEGAVLQALCLFLTPKSPVCEKLAENSCWLLLPIPPSIWVEQSPAHSPDQVTWVSGGHGGPCGLNPPTLLMGNVQAFILSEKLSQEQLQLEWIWVIFLLDHHFWFGRNNMNTCTLVLSTGRIVIFPVET